MSDHIAGTSSASGLAYVTTSLISMIIGWVSMQSVYQVLQLGATVISMGAGLMAIRHYYLQNKKK